MADKATKIATDDTHIEPMARWVANCIDRGLPGGAVEVSVGRPEQRRDRNDNAHFHALIGDIHKQAIISMPGKRVVMVDYDIEVAKTLLVSWYANERELNGEPLSKPPRTITCPVTGERIKVRPSTTKWSKADARQFVQFLHAMGSECGVVFSEPALKEYDQYKEAAQ